MKSLIRMGAVALSIIIVVALSRCGGGPARSPQPLAITTASLPNGTARVAYSQTIKAAGGAAPFNWSVKSGTLPHNLSLSSGATSTATLSGTPDTAVQALPFTIQVSDSAGHVAMQSYIVSILLEPDTLVASPPGLSFGMQVNGTASSAQTLTLTNSGTAPLVLADVATGAADFAANSACGASIPAGNSCSIFVTFKPSALGPRAAALTVTDNSVGSPHSYSLDGTGVARGPNVTFWSGTSYAFSSAPGVTSTPQQVKVANFGTATLDVTSVDITSQFGESDNCVGSIAPGNSCDISVTFTPAASGTVQGGLSLNDNAPASPQTCSLTGDGIAGMCTRKGGFCSNTQQCCPGLKCVFTGGILRPAYRCE